VAAGWGSSSRYRLDANREADMGVQRNQEGGKGENRANDSVSIAIDQKHRAQEQAKSIGEQVREKLKKHYEGTT
jgi:hypothetical protein